MSTIPTIISSTHIMQFKIPVRLRSNIKPILKNEEDFFYLLFGYHLMQTETFAKFTRKCSNGLLDCKLFLEFLNGEENEGFYPKIDVTEKGRWFQVISNFTDAFEKKFVCQLVSTIVFCCY